MIGNISRVIQGSRMQKKKWLTLLILFLGVIPFVGVSIVPLVNGITNSQQTAAPTASPTVSVSPDGQKTKLEDEVRGYEAVLAREPENPTALDGLVKARLGLIQGGHAQISTVIAPLEKLAKLQPDRTDYRVLLGQAQQFTGNKEAAAQSFNSVLAVKPGDMKALQGMAALLVQQQRPEAAVGLLDEAIKKAPQANKLQPGSVDVFAIQLLMGEIYATQKRYPEAIALFDQLSKENKTDFRPVVSKALVLLQQGKTKEAEPLLKSAAALAPPELKDQINQIAVKAQTPASAAPAGQPTVPTTSSPAVSPTP
jgi:tetratricopeptide (TPR) repeat protein